MSHQELTDGTSSVTVFRSRKDTGRKAASRRKRVSETSNSSSDAEDKSDVVKYVDGRKKRKNPMIQSVGFYINDEYLLSVSVISLFLNRFVFLFKSFSSY